MASILNRLCVQKVVFRCLPLGILFIVTWSAWATAESGSKPSSRLAKQFKLEWTVIRYQKSVSVHNPEVAENQYNTDRNEGLSLSCWIHVLNPDCILGISPQPTVTSVEPEELRLQDTPSRSRWRKRYRPLRYESRFKHPKPPAKWLKKMKSVLSIPQDPPPRPQLVSELQPSDVQFDLNVDVLGSSVEMIEEVQGTFHVLVAEAIEKVEVPFEPNENWIPIMKDLEILVRKAEVTDSSYRYRIETRDPSGQNRPRRHDDIAVGNPLPNRLLLAQQMIGEDGEPTRHHSPHSLPAHVGGSGSGSGSGGPIKSIRFLIGVRPRHEKVPFKLESIPLPKP